MLAIDPKRVAGLPVAREPDEEHVSLHDVFGFVRRNLLIVALSTLGAMALGGAYVATTPATYSAEARLIIDLAQARIALQDPSPYSLVMESAQVDSEVEIVKSRAIALAVIQKLDLAAEPEYNRPPGFTTRMKQKVKALFMGPAEIEPGIEDDAIRQVMGAYYGRLGVRRLGQSYVLEISYSSIDARRAAEVANAVVDAYIAAKVDSKADAARRGAEWLEIRLDELGRQANRAAAEVERFKATKGIVTAATGGSLAERQLMDTSTRLLEAEGETTRLQARLDAVDAMLASGEVSDAYVADSAASTVLVTLRQRVIDAAARQSETLERYGAESAAAAASTAELGRLKAEIRDELFRVRKLYSTDLEAARLRQTSTDGSFGRMLDGNAEKSGQYVRLAELESQASTYRRMYETMLQQFTQTVQRQSFPVSDARIVTPAVAPFTTSQPKSVLILGLSTVLGAVLGFAIAFGREALDMRVSSARQVERMIGIPCLGSLPRLPLLTRLLMQAPGPKRLRPRDLREILVEPRSGFSQVLTSAKVSLDLSLHLKMPMLIGVASIAADPRRSRLASNLAFLHAAEGARTLLVDADLLNLGLTQSLALKPPAPQPDARPEASLALKEATLAPKDVKTAAVRPVIFRDIGAGLDFLSLRQAGAPLEPHGAVSRLRQWLQTLRNDYDVVILDLPALRDAADARALGPALDAILIDCAYLGTSIGELAETVASFGPASNRIKGFVLEGAPKARLHA